MKKLLIATSAFLVLVSVPALAQPPWMRGGDGGRRDREPASPARQAATSVVAVADERTNSIIVRAPEEFIEAIDDLVEAIDTVDEDTPLVRVFPLQYADAEELAEVVANMFDESGQSGSLRSRRQGQQRRSNRNDGDERVVLAVADTRTNSLVVSAVAEVMDDIGEVIAQLDSSSAKNQKVFVYSLKNADAENVATILENMFSESSGQRRRTNQSRATQSNRNTNQNQRNTQARQNR